MSFLDRIKDRVFGVLEEVDVKKVIEETDEYKKQEADLIKKLEQAKADYIDRTTLGNTISVDLKRLNSEDISKIAKSILEEDYKVKKQGLDNQYNQAISQANNNLESVKKKAAETVSQAEKEMKENTDKIHAKGMKNNISRSSAVELSKQQEEQKKDLTQENASKAIKEAEGHKFNSVKNAEKVREEENSKMDKEYYANLTAKENELKDLRDSTSEFDNEYIDQREATKYSNELVSLVTEFAQSLPEHLRPLFFEQNKQVRKLLTNDEINYVKNMVL